MENFEETNNMSFVDVEEFNCNVINHSLCIGDDSILLKCLEEEVTAVVETSIEDSLVGSIVLFEEDAFKLYNDHAFRLGPSVRKGNQKFRAGCKTKYLKQFYYYKQGMKSDKEKGKRTYTKVDFRTGFKAMIKLPGAGQLTDMMALYAFSEASYKNNVGYLQELKDSGGSIAAGLRVLKKQVGGSQFVGFTSRDAYNILRPKNLDWGDANSLIQIFRWRKENEDDFYFDFEVDSIPSFQTLAFEKWCSTFSKDFSFGGVLSSQRSEATNHAISRRLSKITCAMFVGYLMKLFLNGGAMQTWKIFVVRNHANEVYITGAYRLFEEQFMKFSEYCQGLVDIAGYSAWRREMLRKFSDLISTIKLNINTGEGIEEGFRMMKAKIASEVEPYYVDNSDNDVGSSNIKDSVGRRAKGEHNIRKKNIVQINCNQARGKRKCALTYTSRI
ncbi:hypothetical protein M9H77_11158 [Catharanthus roseus]|uniref:Uncharacterized protein n=1 Tax=Catharanthus roseus TaxID=4058 RepID=A0ACC0BDU7_CATRO|nr:hypothetical protein M9H77_11158 [Catharanthus roseus]